MKVIERNIDKDNTLIAEKHVAPFKYVFIPLKFQKVFFKFFLNPPRDLLDTL